MIAKTHTVQSYRNFLQHLDLEEVGRFAVTALMDPKLAIAAFQKYDCDFVLLDIGPDGKFEQTRSEWIDLFKKHLQAARIPGDRIRFVNQTDQLETYDVICALNSFGVTEPIAALADLLNSCLHETSRLVIDVRKGSGGFPFLRKYGNSKPVEKYEFDAKEVSRVVLTVEPAEVPENPMQWGKIAKKLLGDTGFFKENQSHSFTFIPRSKDTLCVTFDNLDIAMENRADRRPWGFKFIEDQNWSMLGVMANGWTWFRDPWVTDQFDQLADEGFFAGFKTVIFYGASMGGYGALVFSAAAPGANVVVFSPQTVLDKALVPWETRYRLAWKFDYSDHYGDAVNTVDAAARVSLFFDPYSPLDKAHVDRLSGANLHHYRCPFLGHRLGSSLQQMGILQQVVLRAMEGELAQAEFTRILRQRRGFRRYRREMVDRLQDRGRFKYAAGLCRKFLSEGDDNWFRKVLRRLESEGY